MATYSDETYSFEQSIDPVDTHCILLREYDRTLRDMRRDDPGREHVVCCLMHAVTFLFEAGGGTYSMADLRAIENRYASEYEEYRRAQRIKLLD